MIDEPDPVLLIGAGPVELADYRAAHAFTHAVVAADGGAERAIDLGVTPKAVFGDLDSLKDEVRAILPAGVLHRSGDQDSTDLDKCLSRIKAPLVIGIGFSGGRLDHQLAMCNSLVRFSDLRCIMVGQGNLLFLCPLDIRMDLPPGTHMGLFPMAHVRGTSKGLRWPIDGIAFSPDGRVGTSNSVTGKVELTFSAPKMLVTLPADCLQDAIAALT